MEIKREFVVHKCLKERNQPKFMSTLDLLELPGVLCIALTGTVKLDLNKTVRDLAENNQRE